MVVRVALYGLGLVSTSSLVEALAREIVAGRMCWGLVCHVAIPSPFCY